MSHKQLNPNLISLGKLYLMYHSTYYKGTFLARLLCKAKMMMVAQEWSSVCNGDFSCDREVTWTGRAWGQDPFF